MYFSLANKATYSTGNALRWTKVSVRYYLWYPLPKLTLRLAVLIYSYNSIQLIHFPTYLPVVKPYKCFLWSSLAHFPFSIYRTNYVLQSVIGSLAHCIITKLRFQTGKFMYCYWGINRRWRKHPHACVCVQNPFSNILG
jgi:hypothetical protein